MAVPATELSFLNVLQCIHADVYTLLSEYTLKYYGYAFKQKEMGEILKEYCNEKGLDILL